MPTDTHQLNLIIRQDGFAIEEYKQFKDHTQRRLLLANFDSFSKISDEFKNLRTMSKDYFQSWLIARNFTPWFDVQAPASTDPYPLTLETHTLHYED